MRVVVRTIVHHRADARIYHRKWAAGRVGVGGGRSTG